MIIIDIPLENIEEALGEPFRIPIVGEAGPIIGRLCQKVCEATRDCFQCLREASCNECAGYVCALFTIAATVLPLAYAAITGRLSN